MKIYIYIHIYIVIPRVSRDHITAASVKKRPHWRLFTVFEVSESMKIGMYRSLLHIDRCLCKLGNEDLPSTELPDSIHIPRSILCEIQDDSSMAITKSLWHIVEKTFPENNANFLAPEHQWIFG